MQRKDQNAQKFSLKLSSSDGLMKSWFEALESADPSADINFCPCEIENAKIRFQV